ncbi:N5-glutamine S-adenosyl-L-methionine-dependent methyltransferase [Roseivivax halodurans JCM 10272]|uniref:Release factor glutamine methyltransferase n=1 Tax=Roseivivax halodurans JCM 10272 TaxID=1449350 RepID=X7EHP6_9RHOB|nr:peptide chain release factor N(5)-glutamine methyltransferase [Roseivivax halodurans]ETX14668.1 N5-glutamine S-adenosyl-L-methionine-dependent methyltransferase [Roseivivax halodurans JCM 10272]
MTGSEAIALAVPRLTFAGVPEPARDARRLLAHALGIAPDRLTLVLCDEVPEEIATQFDHLVARRAAREPVSHLTGLRSFWGREFEVTRDVLDPRPETETLIAAALAAPFGRVLDLGTGSGCILLSLLAERGGATGVGTDLSPKALAVARLNAWRHGLEDRATLREGSWTGPLAPEERFDLVVSNPPYIAAAEMGGLAPEVRDHEPALALTDGDDGLTAYRAIADAAPEHMVPSARLLLEIGASQRDDVTSILRIAGFRDVATQTDMDGRSRVVTAIWPGSQGD